MIQSLLPNGRSLASIQITLYENMITIKRDNRKGSVRNHECYRSIVVPELDYEKKELLESSDIRCESEQRINAQQYKQQCDRLHVNTQKICRSFNNRSIVIITKFRDRFALSSLCRDMKIKTPMLCKSSCFTRESLSLVINLSKIQNFN